MRDVLVRPYPVVIDPDVLSYPDLSTYTAWLAFLELFGGTGTVDQYVSECIGRGIIPVTDL